MARRHEPHWGPQDTKYLIMLAECAGFFLRQGKTVDQMAKFLNDLKEIHGMKDWSKSDS